MPYLYSWHIIHMHSHLAYYISHFLYSVRLNTLSTLHILNTLHMTYTAHIHTETHINTLIHTFDTHYYYSCHQPLYVTQSTLSCHTALILALHILHIQSWPYMHYTLQSPVDVTHTLYTYSANYTHLLVLDTQHNQYIPITTTHNPYT